MTGAAEARPSTATTPRPHCQAIVAALPFYADVDTSCLAVLDGCVSACFGASARIDQSWRDSFDYTAESACFRTGVNGSCDELARNHVACGGLAPPDGYAVCEGFCRATEAALIDDIDGICGSDAGCSIDSCVADLAVAAGECGGLTGAQRPCLRQTLFDMGSDLCEAEIDTFL